MSKVNITVVKELESSAEDGGAHSWLTTHQVMAILAVLGFSVPIIAYLWFIHHYGVNMIHGDQWSDVKIIGDSYTGRLSLGALWAQHNENRIFFPNLIVLLLSRTTKFNIVFEEYVSGVLLIVSIGLLILTHRRRAGPIPWVYYSPVAILMLSFVQAQNSLGGFQMAWYLVLLMVAVTFTLLDRPTVTWWVLALAIASSVVASFSSLQGLIIWPVGLLFLYHRRRPKAFTVSWITAAVLTVVVYFVNFDTNTAGSIYYMVRHPIAAIKFFFIAIGDIVGANVSGTNATGIAILLLGMSIVLVSFWVLITYCLGRDEATGRPIATGLICFGLLFAAIVTEGRFLFGLPAASQSRYRTFDLLIVVGLYLAVLEQWTLQGRTEEGTQPSKKSNRSERVSRFCMVSSLSHSMQRAFPILAVIVIAIVCLQVGIGIQTGLADAGTDQAAQVLGARVVVNINRYPDSFVTGTLGAYESANFIRQMAQIEKVHHLSLFATDAVAEYRAEGLIVAPPPIAAIQVPTDGADLKDMQILSATAVDAFGVARVEFEVTGEGRRNVVVSNGKSYQYGWVGLWRTTTVPNGTYILECVAYDAIGDEEGHSPGITVLVKNY